MIYFDNSATTQPYQQVLETYKHVAETYFANPSSLHAAGGEAERLLTRSREHLAQLLGVRSKEIVWTSGGSEGNNLAIKGVAGFYQSRGKHLITTTVEHASTHEAFNQLESLGFAVTRLPVDETGRISLTDLKQAIRPDTILVSMIHVNNETGTIQPVEDVAEMLTQYPKILFHVDHVQGVGKVPVQWSLPGIDLCSISAHKFHGPRGTGLLYVREGVDLLSLISGGGHEHGLRSGTENLPAIVAMTKALRLHLDDIAEYQDSLVSLTESLRAGLENMEGVVINTPVHQAAPHILNISIPGLKPEVVIHALEEEDIYVSTKSACASQDSDASRVLSAAGKPADIARSALRMSLSIYNTKDETETFMTVLQRIINHYSRLEGVH